MFESHNGNLRWHSFLKRSMKTLNHLSLQPLVALMFILVASVALYWAWTPFPLAEEISSRTLLLAIGLAVAIVLAGLYPIHIGNHTKVSLITPPLYIGTVLLPAPVAAVSVGSAILAKEMLVRAKKGNTFSDIAITVSRWTLIALLCSQLWHFFATAALGETWTLFITAIVMFASDILATSFEVWMMRGEPPPHIAMSILREGGVLEGIQYLLGILGVLAAMQQPWAVALLIIPCIAIYLEFKNTKEIQDSTRRLLEGMADAVDLRDPYTGGHSRRVAESCSRILREMHIKGIETNLIVSAARVHDIGKIGIPDTILIKPGKLTPEERKLMETHSDRGAELLARYQDFHRGVEIVRHHHERWDGKGYPRGLRAYEIPFGARVIAVADSFDAMTTDRPYRRAMPVEHARRILNEERGKQWDPAVVDAFLQLLPDSVEQLEVIAPQGGVLIAEGVPA